MYSNRTDTELSLLRGRITDLLHYYSTSQKQLTTRIKQSVRYMILCVIIASNTAAPFPHQYSIGITLQVLQPRIFRLYTAAVSPANV